MTLDCHRPDDPALEGLLADKEAPPVPRTFFDRAFIFRSASALEELHGLFVALRRRECAERSQVPALASAWITLAGIKTITAGF
jgi:hypothetical protein